MAALGQRAATTFPPSIWISMKKDRQKPRMNPLVSFAWPRGDFSPITLKIYKSHGYQLKFRQLIDDDGFFVNKDGEYHDGSGVLFMGDLLISWYQKTSEISPESLSTFQISQPKPDMLILQCGEDINPLDELGRLIRLTGMKLEVVVSEMTDNASIYNIVNEEGTVVAAALLSLVNLRMAQMSVLKGLLHKYGDFTARSKISERLKAMFLAMLCEVIRSMCLTNVRELDKKVLFRWWKSLKLAQHAGFEIQFAIDQLYKVVQAFFGMQAMSSYRKMKSRVDEISNEIEEEEAKLEEKKRQLEKLKSHVDECKYGIEYQSSPVLKECVKHISELKWKKAWGGSPIMFR